jgi:hypothetical protein
MVGAPALAAILAWSVLIEPARLKIHKVTIKTAHWPAAIDPLKMAVIADLHTGSPLNGLDALERLVERVNRLKPDVVLLLGDYVIHGVLFGSFVPPGAIAQALGRLKARHGVLCILGNHDYLYGGARIRRHFERAGLVVLEDEVYPIDRQGGQLWFAGLTDGVSQRPDIKGVFKKIPDNDPAIVLSHDPAVFPHIPQTGFLTLAGHTHGGQLNLPFLNPLCSPHNRKGKYQRGPYRNGTKLMYVSSGVGTSVVPARFNMQPEILFIRLKNSTTLTKKNAERLIKAPGI